MSASVLYRAFGLDSYEHVRAESALGLILEVLSIVVF